MKPHSGLPEKKNSITNILTQLTAVAAEPGDDGINLDIFPSDPQRESFHFFLRRVGLVSISFEKGHCCKHAGPFVSVQEWMVLDKGMQKRASFLKK